MNFDETAYKVWLYDKEIALTENDVRTVLKFGYAAVAAALANGQEVTLPGLGKLVVKQRAEKAGRNPRTGEAITIPAADAAAK